MLDLVCDPQRGHIQEAVHLLAQTTGIVNRRSAFLYFLSSPCPVYYCDYVKLAQHIKFIFQVIFSAYDELICEIISLIQTRLWRISCRERVTTSQMWEATVMYPFFCGQTPAPPLHLHGYLSQWRKYGCEASGFLTNAVQLLSLPLMIPQVQGVTYGFHIRFLLLIKAFVTESVPIAHNF